MIASNLIALLIGLALLVGLWVGVVGLAKAGRSGAWWTMLCGLSLVCLGIAGSVVGGIIIASRSAAIRGSSAGSGSPAFEFMLIAVVVACSIMLGFLLFSIGFAVHGFQARRGRERIEELEMIIAAQNEQLARGESGPTV